MALGKEEALLWFKQFLLENFDVEEDELVDEASISDDLCLDGLDVSEILLSIEDYLGLDIDHREYDKWETYGDMINSLSASFD